MPGVRAIFHRENIGKIFRSAQGQGFEGIIDERRPPFEDDVVRYYGQYIALAVADTFESAKAAADAVRATYARDKPNVETESRGRRRAGRRRHHLRTRPSACRASAGIADGAFATAPVKLDQTYVTPTETHNPIELHATTAIWDGPMLTIYEESQGVFNLQERSRADVRPAQGERPGHHEVRRLGLRQQALALDALRARRRGGAASSTSRSSWSSAAR